MSDNIWRGVSQSGGKWLYGDYVYHDHGIRNNKNAFYIMPKGSDKSKLYWDDFLVDGETVGNFIGILDKNDVKIFRGDIVKCFDRKFIIDDKGEFQVLSTFRKLYARNDKEWARWAKEHLEVVGNIHDKEKGK